MNTFSAGTILILLVTAALFCISPAAAANTNVLPLDENGDGMLTADELSPSVLTYLTQKYIGSEHNLEPDADLSDAAYIYAFWGGKPKTVRDSEDQTIVLYRPIHNAVVMNSETLEIMRSLGLEEDRVVGVGKYILANTAFFPEYSTKDNVGSVWSPDYEKIISLSPDAVFLYADFMKADSDEIQERIQSMNPSINVFRFDLYNPSDYAEEVETLASVLDREEEGEKLTAFYSEQMDRIASVTDKIPEDERVSVYFESWDDYKSCANGSGYNEKINLAGGQNIFENEVPAYPVVNPESILLSDPEVIVKLIGSGSLDFGGYDNNDKTEAAGLDEYLTQRAGWQNLRAVEDNRLHIISSDILGGPEYIIGSLYFTKWFYPEECAGLDPQSVHQEYLNTFQHLDFNVSDDGLFAYP